MKSTKSTRKITIPLTPEQERDLRDIRNEFDVYRMHAALDSLFTYALDGMGSSCHAEDASADHWQLTRAKKLVAILLQPNIEI